MYHPEYRVLYLGWGRVELDLGTGACKKSYSLQKRDSEFHRGESLIFSHKNKNNQLRAHSVGRRDLTRVDEGRRAKVFSR